MNILEQTIYREPEGPPRTRTKPMEVICPGFPRSATESLQTALLKLGYDHTYHGWDILFEEPNYMQGWCRLARKKWHGAGDGESNITRADFDALLGHSVAVTDMAASVFAAEMIAAYPEAKVVLNTRRDLEAWHRSAIVNLAAINESWLIYFTSWTTANGYWSWITFQDLLGRLLFRATGCTPAQAIRRNGKWVYREHCNMIRGLVPKENLLEWSVEDGWEPLCKFLGKEVPKEPFPRTNDAAGFGRQVERWHANQKQKMIRNVGFMSVALVGGIVLASRRFAPDHMSRLGKTIYEAVRSIGR